MGSEHSDVVSDYINRLIDEVRRDEVEVRLTPDTVAMLEAQAEAGGWTIPEMLASAFTHGVLLLAEGARMPPAANRDVLLARLQDLHSTYAALKFQVYKLQRAVLVEEARLGGRRGQRETYEHLSRRLLERIDQFDAQH